MQSLKDPNSVAAIIDALRRVHGDAAARLMLVGGMTLADVITSLLRLPIKNRTRLDLTTSSLSRKSRGRRI
jgi:hypothetical protein